MNADGARHGTPLGMKTLALVIATSVVFGTTAVAQQQTVRGNGAVQAQISRSRPSGAVHALQTTARKAASLPSASAKTAPRLRGRHGCEPAARKSASE